MNGKKTHTLVTIIVTILLIHRVMYIEVMSSRNIMFIEHLQTNVSPVTDDGDQSSVLSTCPLYTNSGCGKERRILIGPYGDLPRQHSFGSILRFTGLAPADSRQGMPSVRNYVTR